MKITNHTPGPWAVSPQNNIISRNGTVAKTEQMPGNYESEQKANANLLAAAPDLLSALIALEKASREVLDTSATHDGLENCKILLEARVAIQKAKGEA